VTYFKTESAPSQVFTHWLNSAEKPLHFSYGEYCKLVDNVESTASVVCKNQSIDTLEVRQHIATGMHVASISLHYEESVNFRINDELFISSIHYTDIFADKVFDNLDIDEATAVQFFDADFTIMVGEFKRIRTALIESIDTSEY
jgi:recombination associated protein RdgC